MRAVARALLPEVVRLCYLATTRALPRAERAGRARAVAERAATTALAVGDLLLRCVPARFAFGGAPPQPLPPSLSLWRGRRPAAVAAVVRERWALGASLIARAPRLLLLGPLKNTIVAYERERTLHSTPTEVVVPRRMVMRDQEEQERSRRS